MELIIATDASVPLDAELARRLQVLVLPRQVMVGKKVLAADELASHGTETATLLPARLDETLSVLRKFSHAHIVAIHSAETLDTMAHKVKLAGGMLSPQTQLHVYEAQLVNYPLALLVETAARYLNESDDDVTPDQLQVVLQRVEELFRTVWFCKKTGTVPIEPALSFGQKISCLFGRWVSAQYDPTAQVLKQITPAQAAAALNADETRLAVEWYRRGAAQTKKIEQQADRLLSTPNYTLQELAIRNPGLPAEMIQVTAYPTPSVITRTVEWVRRWSKIPLEPVTEKELSYA